MIYLYINRIKKGCALKQEELTWPMCKNYLQKVYLVMSNHVCSDEIVLGPYNSTKFTLVASNMCLFNLFIPVDLISRRHLTVGERESQNVVSIASNKQLDEKFTGTEHNRWKIIVNQYISKSCISNSTVLLANITNQCNYCTLLKWNNSTCLLLDPGWLNPDQQKNALQSYCKQNTENKIINNYTLTRNSLHSVLNTVLDKILKFWDRA